VCAEVLTQQASPLANSQTLRATFNPPEVGVVLAQATTSASIVSNSSLLLRRARSATRQSSLLFRSPSRNLISCYPACSHGHPATPIVILRVSRRIQLRSRESFHSQRDGGMLYNQKCNKSNWKQLTDNLISFS